MINDTFDCNKLRAELSQDEGSRLFVYDDATGKQIVAGTHVIGNPTIGIGRNLSGKGITIAEQYLMHTNDIDETCKSLDTHIYWWRTLDQVRQRVVINLCFNVGLCCFLTFKQFLSHLQSMQYDAAADDLINSKWYNETGDRAKRLVSRIRTGSVAYG